MKTLIVFVLYLVITEARYRLPIEVYEIKETNDRNSQLYIQNDNHPSYSEERLLWRLLQPYIKPKTSAVDEVTRNLLQKLKFHTKNKLRGIGVKDLFVVDADTVGVESEDSSIEVERFNDKTRDGRDSESSNLIYRIIPGKRWNSNQRSIQQSALRTYEDRTAAPRHRYIYEEEDE